MQIYRLLGTLNTQLQRKVLVGKLQSFGWELVFSNEDDDGLKHKGVKLNIEGEGTLLLNAGFTGKPEDISSLLGCLDRCATHYSLDLFGDSARLVRRFVK